jgi:hypothetical protein
VTEITKNINFVAFQRDLDLGKFKSFKPGTWVGYANGEYIGSNINRIDILKELRNIPGNRFITQVNIERETARVRSPRLVENIKRKKKPKRA